MIGLATRRLAHTLKEAIQMCRTDRSGRTQNRCPQDCEEVHKPRADWSHWEAEGHKDWAYAGTLLHGAADGYPAAQW